MTIRIICFHRVVREAQRNHQWPWLLRGSAITDLAFEALLKQMSDSHDWVNEEEVVAVLRGSRRTRPACWVTFDDGYRDNLEVAAPILAAFGIQPTLFVTTQVLEPGFRLPVDRWYDTLLAARRPRTKLDLGEGVQLIDLEDPQCRQRLLSGPEKRRFVTASTVIQTEMLARLRAALDCRVDIEWGASRIAPYLCAAELSLLSENGWFVGPHGASHQLLPHLPEDQFEAEVLGSAKRLSSLRLRKSQWTAWPDGCWTPDAARRLESHLHPLGYFGALTIDPRLACAGDDPWAIPRFVM